MAKSISLCISIILALGGQAGAITADAEYQIIKKITREFYDQALYGPIEEIDGASMLECSWVDIADPPAEGLHDGLRLVARDVVHAEMIFDKLGYTREIYEKAIDDLETNLVRAIKRKRGVVDTRPYFASAAIQINKRRKRIAPNLPEAYVGGDCDTELLRVPLVLPPGARFWQISEFEFRVCKARAIDPWSLSACRGWKEARDEVVGGAVSEYQIMWADGVVQKSPAPLDVANGEDMEPKPFVPVRETSQPQ